MDTGIDDIAGPRTVRKLNDTRWAALHGQIRVILDAMLTDDDAAVILVAAQELVIQAQLAVDEAGR